MSFNYQAYEFYCYCPYCNKRFSVSTFFHVEYWCVNFCACGKTFAITNESCRSCDNKVLCLGFPFVNLIPVEKED